MQSIKRNQEKNQINFTSISIVSLDLGSKWTIQTDSVTDIVNDTLEEGF